MEKGINNNEPIAPVKGDLVGTWYGRLCRDEQKRTCEFLARQHRFRVSTWPPHLASPRASEIQKFHR